MSRKKNEMINDTSKGTVAILSHYRKMKWKRDSLKDHMISELTYGWDSLSEGLDWLMEFAPEGKRKKYENYVSRLVDEQTLIETIDICVDKLGTLPEIGAECRDLIKSKYIDGDYSPCDEEVRESIGLGKNRYYKIKKEAINILTIFIWSSIGDKDK